MDIKSIQRRLNNSFVYRFNKRPVSLRRPFILNLNNQTFKIPLREGFGERNTGLKEGWFSLLIRSFNLPEGSDLLDIGVNEGQSLLIFKSSYKNVTYWGFEPNPNSVSYVDSLIKANNFEETYIIPVGLSSKSSVVKLYIKNESDSTATISKELRAGFYNSEQIKHVAVFAFDELELDIKKISFIKIDVEGVEVDVIGGMQNTIQKHQPIISCEVLDYHSPESQEYSQNRANQLMDYFNQMGYSAYRIHFDQGKIEYESITTIELKQWTTSSLTLNDYLFTPGSLINFPIKNQLK